MTTWVIDPASSEAQQRKAAAGLAATGAKPGDRAAFALPNSPALLAAVMGAMRTGVVPVMINASLLPSERDLLLADADAAVVISDAAGLASLMDSGRPADLAPLPLCRPMHYTSGTSGRPKGVWPGVLSEADAKAMHDDEAAVWDLGPADVHLTCSPLYHSVAIRFSAQALLRGAPVVLMSHFDAGEVADALAGPAGVRSAFMVPTHITRLLALAPDALAGLRMLVHAGAPCPEPLKRRLLAAGPEVWEFYGATEGQFTVCPPSDWLAHPGTVGRARPGRQLMIEDGQIWCSVPPFSRWEYWRDPQKTAAAWRGSAFTVGDLGRLDADGFLYLDGRRDDLIISGGVNVYPAEVEQALAGAPGVSEVAVFGVTDDQWGQRVSAAVIGDTTADAVLAHARQVLAGYKRPKQVFIVSDLPRTGTGKIKRLDVAAALGL